MDAWHSFQSIGCILSMLLLTYEATENFYENGRICQLIPYTISSKCNTQTNNTGQYTNNTGNTQTQHKVIFQHTT